MYLYTIAGLITGFFVVGTIKYYEKIEHDYGVLNVPLSVFLFAISVAGYFLPGKDLDDVSLAEGIVFLLSLMAVQWLLLTTSYMDQRCGYFQLGILLLAGMVCTFLLATGLIAKSISLSSYYVRAVLIICLALFIIHKTGGYSLGDYCILLVCQSLYIILCEDVYVYLGTNLIAFFVTLMTYLLRNLIRIKWVVREKRRLPFTMYIAIGFYAALLVAV